MTKSMILICNKHGLSEHSLSGIKKPRWKCKKCLYLTSKTYLKRLKTKCIEYKGGQCELCGYNKCNRALHFHHTNPDEKDFSIGDRNPFTNIKGTKKWSSIKKELDKCVLLCSNCHYEEHEKEEHEKEEQNQFAKFNFNRVQLNLANNHILKGRKSPDECLQWAIEYFNN